MNTSRSWVKVGDGISFYQDGDLVGHIDYSDKSQAFIDSATENWTYGVLTVETIEEYSLPVKDGEPYIDFDMSFSSMRDK